MRPPSLVQGPSSLRRRQESALTPVRARMLREAEAEAEKILADARRAADALVDRARTDAVTAVSRAEAEGRQGAAPLAFAEVSRGRREARTILLSAELRARAELEDRIRRAISDLRNEPGYGELRDRLADLARRAAGRDATASEQPGGGVVARAPGVLVDCSLPRLAERVIEVLGQQIRELSTP